MMHTARTPAGHGHAPGTVPGPPPSPPPPSRQNLKAWWSQFKFVQRAKGAKDVSTHAYGKDDGSHPVFGVPLRESLKYASVQVSTANSNGELYVWGDIPVVVAKCGLYLKENATEIEGTFRVSGSSKRMRDLQAVFETPPKYGKNLDWKNENYTPHDVASVFRRYLTQMPEPVIPYSLYNKFREAMAEGRSQDDVIKTYKQLIRSMPRQNQYLLLYVLDLLSVFARRSEKNLMTATNLAVIFRPGLISHPSHEMSPKEHQLSQEVLEFLIEHQDWFMLDVPPPPPSRQGSSAPSPLSPQPAYLPIPTDVAQASGSGTGSGQSPTNGQGANLTRRGSKYEERRFSDDRDQDKEAKDVPHALGLSTPQQDNFDALTIASASPSEPGWKIVERGRRVGRRRSSSSGSASRDPAAQASGSGHIRIASADAREEGNVGTYATLAAVTVSRSRTLPSRRTASRDQGTGSSSHGHGAESSESTANRDREKEGKPNVLKKQKRASMQPQAQRNAPSAPIVPTVGREVSGSSTGTAAGS